MKYTNTGGIIGLIILLIPVTILIIEGIHGPYTQEELNQLIHIIIVSIAILATIIGTWLVFRSPFFVNFKKVHEKELGITGVISVILAGGFTFLFLFLKLEELPPGTDAAGPVIFFMMVTWAIIFLAWLGIKKIITLLNNG